jgi:para-aminobenzoate synthetase/4-amino-4-deoxychorismate lyase
MRVISELEPHARVAFTGAIGFASSRAGLDLSVTIRAFELGDGDVRIDVGGGVVADSTPDGELAEALTKARGPIAALGATLAGGEAAAEDVHDLPRALAYGARPDPAAGLLETVLVRDGKPVALDDHLARLAESASAELARELPADIRQRLDTACAAGPADARLRIVLTAHDCTVATHAIAPAHGAPVVLRPVLLPGGLGRHKWADRRLLDALGTAFNGAVPLLVDGDGSVLEAAYANVWVADGDRWLTPRADGRILPGTTRARLIAERAGAAEATLYLRDLRAAPRLLLTSSIRGAHEAVLA